MKKPAKYLNISKISVHDNFPFVLQEVGLKLPHHASIMSVAVSQRKKTIFVENIFTPNYGMDIFILDSLVTISCRLIETQPEF